MADISTKVSTDLYPYPSHIDESNSSTATNELLSKSLVTTTNHIIGKDEKRLTGNSNSKLLPFTLSSSESISEILGTNYLLFITYVPYTYLNLPY